jgi:exosome complex component MTR3
MQAVVGGKIWLDPTTDEARYSSGTLLLACIPALGTVTSVWHSGAIEPQTVVEVRHPSLHEIDG